MKPKDEIEKLADKCLGSWTKKKEYQHIVSNSYRFSNKKV